MTPSSILCLVLILVQASATQVEDANQALITPAAQLSRRQSSNPERCGYIDGDFRTPLICSSEYTCSQSLSRFACCNDKSCPGDYQACFSTDSSQTTFGSCTYASSRCLYCSGVNSICAFYTLTSGTYYDNYFQSLACTDGPAASYITVKATPTNAPRETIACAPSGFTYPTDDNVKCAAPAVLLIPLMLSNVIFIAVNILMSSMRFQHKLNFWSSPKDEDDPWKPWGGLSTVLLFVVQAIVTAALIRAGGYKADWINLILLWLMRPRMLWAVMLMYSIFGKQYKRSAMDLLFADGILNILSIPILAWFLQAYLANQSACDSATYDSGRYVLNFGSEPYMYGFILAPMICLPFALTDLFIYVAFIWKRKLSRGWAAGAAFWSFGLFAMAWFFWVFWVFFSEDSFCVSNVAAIAAIHAVFPLLSATIRALAS